MHTAAAGNRELKMPHLHSRELSWGRTADSLLFVQHTVNAESKTPVSMTCDAAKGFHFNAVQCKNKKGFP